MAADSIIKVLTASPRDIVIEHKIIKEVCLGLNESPLLRGSSITFENSSWEQSIPRYEKIERVIERLVTEHDVLVCIVHEDMFVQPAHEETLDILRFLSAYELWKKLKKPHIMMYYKESSDPSHGVGMPGQSIRVPELCPVAEEKAVFFERFSAPYELCESIYNHLEQYIVAIIQKH